MLYRTITDSTVVGRGLFNTTLEVDIKANIRFMAVFGTHMIASAVLKEMQMQVKNLDGQVLVESLDRRHTLMVFYERGHNLTAWDILSALKKKRGFKQWIPLFENSSGLTIYKVLDELIEQ